MILADGELSGTEKVLLQLAHRDESCAHDSLRDTSDLLDELDNDNLLELAEWIYLYVEEVWSGFNLLAESVADGFELPTRFKKDQARVDAWSDMLLCSRPTRRMRQGSRCRGGWPWWSPG